MVDNKKYPIKKITNVLFKLSENIKLIIKEKDAKKIPFLIEISLEAKGLCFFLGC